MSGLKFSPPNIRILTRSPNELCEPRVQFCIYLRGGVGRWGARRAGGWWAPGRSWSVGVAPRPASFCASDAHLNSLSSAPHRPNKQTQAHSKERVPVRSASGRSRSLPPSLPPRTQQQARFLAARAAQHTQDAFVQLLPELELTGHCLSYI